MAVIDILLAELDERTIAQRVSLLHDEARIRYRSRTNTVGDFDEFARVIGDYYQHHFAHCISPGSALPQIEAVGRAKKLLEQEYGRKGGNLISAFNDAHDGTNGGLRVVLDVIAEALKGQSVELYINDVFDRYVAPNSWEDQVEIIRQFLNKHSSELSSSVNIHQPERYARDYKSLIRSYIHALRTMSSVFRKL